MADKKKDIYDYLELISSAKNQKEMDGYIEEALLLEPNNLQLLLIKNEKNRKDIAKYIAGLENIVAIGDKQMTKEGYFKNDKGDFWLVFETRPYMTVCYQYLTTLIENGFITKAIHEGERLLELCSGDNLGVRYDLMHLFAFKEDKERAEKLFEEQNDDRSAQMLLPLCLLYYKIGETENAKKLLIELNGKNKDLPKFVKRLLSGELSAELDDGFGLEFGYRPDTIEELLSEYERYFFVFEICPAFFAWAKTTLDECKGSKKNNSKSIR